MRKDSGHLIDTGMLNPFMGSVVSDPWRPAGVDVLTIHAEAFDRCCQAVDFVQKARQSTSLIIHGEAGSGKTHLMARLRSYLEKLPLVFVSISLQTAPQMIWRHLRRCLIDDLLRPGDQGQTQFDKVVIRRSVDRLFQSESLLSQVQMDHDFFCVLNLLLQGSFRRETRAWLRGDSLTETDLAKINLPALTEEEEDPEDKARRVVLSLANLFGPEVGLVFCFDQVEALQNRPGEKAGLFAFGKMVRALHDGTGNALLISCIQSSFVDPLYDSVDQADQDRLARYGKFTLLPLQYDQAVALISARLNALSELAERRSGRPRLWPLNESDLQAFFEQQTIPTITARKIIAYCAQLFEAVRGKPVKASVNTSDFLEELWQQALEKAAAANIPEDSDPILQHGLSGLMGIQKDPWRENQDETLKDIDLIFSPSKGKRIEISLCNQQNMTGLAYRLKRLSEGLKKGGFQKLILIRDPRLPIKTTARKVKEYLGELKKSGARLIHPPMEVLAALDALRSLLSEARAGDLAHRGLTVGPNTLQQWLVENIPPALQDFMEKLTAEGEDVFPGEALLALLEENLLLKLNEAAVRLDQPPSALWTWVRKNPGLVGLLNGPPALLFQIVPDSFSSDCSEVPA